MILRITRRHGVCVVAPIQACSIVVLLLLLSLVVVAVLAARPSVALSSSASTPSTPRRRRRYLIARHGETNFNKEMREQGTLDTPILTLDGIAQAAGLGMYIARRQQQQEQEEATSDASDEDDDSALLAVPPRISRTFCSPMLRCRQSYAVIEGCCGGDRNNTNDDNDNEDEDKGHRGLLLPTPTIQEDLREIELREWQGRFTQEIKQNDAKKWKIFLDDPHLLQLGGGDEEGEPFIPVVDCWNRGNNAWKRIRAEAAAAAINDGDNKKHNNNNNNNNNNNTELITGEEGATFVMCHGGMGQCLLLQALGLDISLFRKHDRYAFGNCGCIEVDWADDEEYCERWRRVYPVTTDWMLTSDTQQQQQQQHQAGDDDGLKDVEPSSL